MLLLSFKVMEGDHLFTGELVNHPTDLRVAADRRQPFKVALGLCRDYDGNTAKVFFSVFIAFLREHGSLEPFCPAKKSPQTFFLFAATGT